MEIKYPKKNKYKGKNIERVVEIKMTEEQKHWYEIGYMCGYAKCLEEKKDAK